MALINCSECGKEVSDKAKACPNCGCPINEEKKESKVMIYGYTESYIFNPKVKIFINDQEVGSVAKGQLFEMNIDRDTEIVFKCNMRKSSIIAKAGQITKVKLSWNRITGQLVPQIIDFNTADSNFW